MLEVNTLANQTVLFSIDSSDSREAETDVKEDFLSILESIEAEYSVMKKHYISSESKSPDTEEKDIESDEELEFYKKMAETINAIDQLSMYIKSIYLDTSDAECKKLIYQDPNDIEHVESIYLDSYQNPDDTEHIKSIFQNPDDTDFSNVFLKLNEAEKILESINYNKESANFEKGMEYLNNILEQVKGMLEETGFVDYAVIDEIGKRVQEISRNPEDISDSQPLRDEEVEFEEIKDKYHEHEIPQNNDIKHLNLGFWRVESNENTKEIGIGGSKYKQQKKDFIIGNDAEHLNLEFEEIKLLEKSEEASNADLESSIENIRFENTTNEQPLFLNMPVNDAANIDSNTETGFIQDYNIEELFQQIVEKLHIIKNQDKQEVRIKLKPDYLGELVLKMELEDGAIDAKLIVDNLQTKEIIESGLLQLREQFENNGLEIKAIEVFIGSNEKFEGERRNRHSFSRNSSRLRINKSVEKELNVYNVGYTGQNAAINYEGRLNLFV